MYGAGFCKILNVAVDWSLYCRTCNQAHNYSVIDIGAELIFSQAFDISVNVIPWKIYWSWSYHNSFLLCEKKWGETNEKSSSLHLEYLDSTECLMFFLEAVNKSGIDSLLSSKCMKTSKTWKKKKYCAAVVTASKGKPTGGIRANLLTYNFGYFRKGIKAMIWVLV